MSSLPASSVINIYQSPSSYNFTPELIREISYAFFNHELPDYYESGEIIPFNQQEILDKTLLIKGTRVPMLNHILATDDYKELNEINSKPPSGALSLEYIYGWQCGHRRDTMKYFHRVLSPMSSSLATMLPQHDNIISHENCKKEIIYFASRFVIIQDLEANTQKIFQGHHMKVTCFDINNYNHPGLVVSCGLDNEIVIWDSNLLLVHCRISTPHDTGITYVKWANRSNSELILTVGSGKQGVAISNYIQERGIIISIF